MSGDGRPEVTVSNPAAPRAPVDVVGHDVDVPDSSRRPLLVLLVVLVLLAGVGGLNVVRERRAAAGLERELASTVQLTAETDELDAGGSYSGDDGISLELTVGVRNDGPRPVTLERLALGDFVGQRSAEVVPGGLARVTLRRDFSCLQEPAFLRQGQPLLATVRTGDGVERTADLGRVPSSFSTETPRELCGYVGPEQALGAFFSTTSLDGEALVMTLSLFNQGRYPLTVNRPEVVDGLRVQVNGDQLPLVLPATARAVRPEEVRVQLSVTVDDCSATQGAGDPGVLLMQVTDGRGELPAVFRLMPEGLGELVMIACPRG